MIEKICEHVERANKTRKAVANVIVEDCEASSVDKEW